jgi:hypothetical protein
VTEQEVFILADQALLHVVEQIKDDQWETVVPTEKTPRQPGSTLRKVINCHAYDEAGVPDALAGKTIDEVGYAHDGHLLGDDPKAAFARIVATAVSAVRAFTDLDKTVHLTYGALPAREYLSSTSPTSAAAASTTSRTSSAPTRPCPPTSCRGCGKSLCLTRRTSVRWASTRRMGSIGRISSRQSWQLSTRPPEAIDASARLMFASSLALAMTEEAAAAAS